MDVRAILLWDTQSHTESHNILVHQVKEEHVDKDLRARALHRKRLVEQQCSLKKWCFLGVGGHDNANAGLA